MTAARRAVTPGQTVGPFFAFALPYDGGGELVAPGRADAIRLHGRVLDGAGAPVPDALLELWQGGADSAAVAAGGSLHRDGWTFTGWGRAATDDTGHYTFTTVRPKAPFLALTVFARGLLDRLQTRVYLPPVPDDALLAGLPADRRATLIAEPDEHGFVFDVRLQGAAETVFLRHDAAPVRGSSNGTSVNGSGAVNGSAGPPQ